MGPRRHATLGPRAPKSAHSKTLLTEAEYLERERQAEYKSEYSQGEMFAMSGASEMHNLLATNLAATLHAQLPRRPCRVYGSEILSPSTEAYDRGRKAEHYRQIEPLAEYLLVAQDRMHVDLYTRRPDGTWSLKEASRPKKRWNSAPLNV